MAGDVDRELGLNGHAQRVGGAGSQARGCWVRGERVDGHVGVLLHPSYGLHRLQVAANLLARARRGLRAVGLLLDQVGQQEHLLI